MYMYVAIGLCALYIIPYYVLGTNAHISIFDNLDGNIPAWKALVDSGHLLSPNDALLPQIFNGLPRGTLPSELEISTLAYVAFSPYYAYVACRLLAVVLAFVGMYLLLSRHIVQGKQNSLVHFGVAACFAVLPYPSVNLAVATAPLALYAFLNLRCRRRGWDAWGILILYPFVVNLPLGGLFFLLVVSAIFVKDILVERVVNWRFFCGLALTSAVFVFSHYRLFQRFVLGTSYISHRFEFSNASWVIDFPAAATLAKHILLRGHDSYPSLHVIAVLPAICLSVMLLARQRVSNKNLLWSLLFLVVMAVFCGAWGLGALLPLKEKLFRILPMQLDRFATLAPMFWYVAFAAALFEIRSRLPRGELVAIAAILLQLGYSFTYHELYRERKSPNFASFYAAGQFAQIKSFIGKDPAQYRVVSLGLYPGVALYNGFYVLDGYFNDYPLEYKHKFRGVISKELERCSKAQEYFDSWGSRCYVFPAELWPGVAMNLKGSKTVRRLDLDYQALWAMGARYIISSVHIDTAGIPHLSFLRKFEDLDSAWDIYLYRILPDHEVANVRE